MELVSRLIVIAAGLWLLCVSLFIIARPEYALRVLRKFASTNFLNYTELTLRLIVGLGLYGLAKYSTYEIPLEIGGGFLAATAIMLMLIPRRWHHNYALWWADRLKPWQARLAAVFSLALGPVLIWIATQ